MADDDEDDAALARSFGAVCLRVLREMSEQIEEPELAVIAWAELLRHLVQLKRFLATPGISVEARAQTEAMLRGFLDS